MEDYRWNTGQKREGKQRTANPEKPWYRRALSLFSSSWSFSRVCSFSGVDPNQVLQTGLGCQDWSSWSSLAYQPWWSSLCSSCLTMDPHSSFSGCFVDHQSIKQTSHSSDDDKHFLSPSGSVWLNELFYFYIIYFCFCEQMPDLRGEEFTLAWGLRYCPSWWGRARPQECEMADHIVFPLRNQRERNAGTKPAFSFTIQSRIPALRMEPPTFRMGLLTSINAI